MFRLAAALVMIRNAVCKRTEMSENTLLSTWSDTMHSALIQEAQAGAHPNGAETSFTIVATVNKGPGDQAVPANRLGGNGQHPARAKGGVAYPVNIEFRESPYYTGLKLENEDDSTMDRNERRELIKQVLFETMSQRSKNDRQGHRAHQNDRNLAVGQISGAAILLTVCVLLAF